MAAWKLPTLKPNSSRCHAFKRKNKMQEMTYEEWMKRGTELFGEDQMKWKFICPICRHVASAQDYKDAGAPQGAIGFSCIGRYIKSTRRAFGDENSDTNGHPCDYTGGGLFKLNPLKITHEGEEFQYFDFAEGKKNNAI